LSINSALDASDVLLGSRPVLALIPGASQAASLTLAIPPQTTARSYFILAVADGDNMITEALENNNSSPRSISITAPAGP
jgi:subtilase family serine protease